MVALRFVYILVLLHFAKRELETILRVAFTYDLSCPGTYFMPQRPPLLQGINAFHVHLQEVSYLSINSLLSLTGVTAVLSTIISSAVMHQSSLFTRSTESRFSSGLLLAYDIYRPAFSATSSNIVGTTRSNEQFLWICTGVWVVSSFVHHPDR